MDRAKFEIFCAGAHGQDASLIERLKLQSVNEVVWALVPRQPPVYNEHRWSGDDVAIDSIGILHSRHGLFEPAYIKFAKAMHSASTRSSRKDGSKAGKSTGTRGGGLGDEAPAAGGADDGDEKSKNDSAPEVNAKHRAQGVAFVVSEQSFLLPALRSVIGPIQELLRSTLHVGGAEWELEQRSISAKNGGTGEGVMGKHRVQVAAHLTLETKCLCIADLIEVRSC